MLFEAAHAIGNIAFALLAGPAMIRMLVRFRERFEWRAPVVTAVLLLALAFVSTMPAVAGAAGSGQAANWLASNQNSDGGFGDSPGESSSASTTAWVMLGFEAAGRNPLDISRGGKTPVDYLRAKAGELSSAGDFARTILAVEGSGLDSRSFGGRDLVSALLNRRRTDGSWEGWPGVTSTAIVALRAAGATGGLEKSQSWLAGAQGNDGGWGDQPDGPSNADVTGEAMQAMPGTKAAQRGLSYLRTHQHGDGGFSLGGSGAVNSQSTAWAAQGMIAVGADAGEALGYLASLQESDGHYRYSSSSDQTSVWVTGQVLVPVSGEDFPVAVPARAPKPTPTTITAAPAPTVTPIPGVTSPPSSPTIVPGPTQSAAPPGNSGGTTGGAGPLVPPAGATGAVPPGPSVGGIVAATPESIGAAPATTTASDSDGDDGGGSGPSPWIPAGIGLIVATLAVTVPWALGRRFAW